MKKFEIITKKRLAPNVNEYVVYAPLVAKHCLAGQFIILRTDEDGERVPFTICDYSREDGTVSILVQEVGYTTMKLALMQEGECLAEWCRLYADRPGGRAKNRHTITLDVWVYTNNHVTHIRLVLLCSL